MNCAVCGGKLRSGWRHSRSGPVHAKCVAAASRAEIERSMVDLLKIFGVMLCIVFGGGCILCMASPRPEAKRNARPPASAAPAQATSAKPSK